ncbi:MAG: T9SS type A sorting domain-containing protein [Crocinitomicaceae bacterium]
MKKVFKSLFFIAIINPLLLSSQEVVSVQGDSYNNDNKSVDFTIGEIIINTVSDSTNDITQGFHQTKWDFLNIELHNSNVEIKVYPNPVEKQLNIETFPYKNINYKMYNNKGQVVLEGILTQEITSLNTENLQSANYTLILLNDKKEKIKTYKLIKY